MVEILIAMLLAAILTSGLFYMMSGQSQAYRTQISSLTTQENLWGAMEFLQRNVRMAGFGMGHCPGGQITRYDASSGTTKPWLAPIRVYNGCNLFSDTHVPPCPSSTADSPDSFSVAYSTHASGMIAVRTTQAIIDSAATNPILVASPGSFGVNDWVALWQPGTLKRCVLFELSGAPRPVGGVWELPRASGGTINPPDGTNILPLGGYDAGSLVLKVLEGNAAQPPILIERHFSVRIDESRPEIVPELITWTRSDKSDVEVVADGVEDMQVSFACDDTGDGEYTEGGSSAARQTDEWAYNTGGETDTDTNHLPDPMLCTQGIGQVRLNLITRSANQADTQVQASNKRPMLEDRPEAASADAFTRRRLTTVVEPRNTRPPS